MGRDMLNAERGMRKRILPNLVSASPKPLTLSFPDPTVAATETDLSFMLILLRLCSEYCVSDLWW